MTEYRPPYSKNGTYLQIETAGREYRSSSPEFYLLDDDSGEIASKFFERLGNPTYNLGPETYHDSGYNSYAINHGFTIPDSSKFRFHEPKTARFNELACPIDNQRRVHGYFLCYGIDSSTHSHQFIGGRVILRQGEEVFGFPWGYGSLSVENVTRVEVVDKNLIGERGNTWDLSQNESSGEDFILLQDTSVRNLFPSRFDASIYIFEVSDRTSNPGTAYPTEPTDSSETLSTRYNTPIAHSSALSNNIFPLRSYDEDAENDLKENLFLTVHPAAASKMSFGEKTDMYHLANGYFGKGSFYHKPGLKMLPHQFLGDFNINVLRDSIQRFNTPQEYGIYIENQDAFLQYDQEISCDITTDGFIWVENLLSEPETSIHSSQYTNSSQAPSVTQNITVRTLLGEHHWWDTTASGNRGAKSSEPFFRVTGTTVGRDGTAEKHLEQGYPALIAFSRTQRSQPITAQLVFNTRKWKRNLRDFCIRSAIFPETLYFRFNNYALNPKTMTILGEDLQPSGGGDGNRQLSTPPPGYDPTNPPPGDDRPGNAGDHTKYSMLEVDIIPMNTDIFPTSLPIMWSNQAFQFFYDKATGDEATAINRLQNSVLDYGYEVMTVGQDYYDNTNAVTTDYPFAFSGEEYSKVFRENSTKLISSNSEWVFPSHLTELPSTASDYQNLLCFAIREPSGHRLIISNISCVV